MSRSEGKPPTVADSTMLDDRPQAQPKKRLDDLPTTSRERYDIAGEHARGGLGVILRAHDQHLERTVAIKEIGANADERASTRFVREALITARLQHPGIVPVYEAGRWPNGARFYAMKMVSGRTLREELKAHDDLEGRLALVPSVLAVAEAVGYAHAEGVIHRDLKPDNVMVGAFGETVVVDWGLAKDRRLGGEAPQPGLYAQTHAEATHIGAVIGTPAYMSPEQARGEDVDERADVWAIGAILYHLLAAHPPYVGAPDSVIQRVANEPAPPLADKAPGAPRDLVAIVNKAMARDPKARYANAKELAGDLSRFLTGQLVGAREYNRLARIEHWVKQHRAPVIVAAILLAILAVTASFSIVRILEERRVAQNRSDELLLTQARSQLDRDPTAALAWIKQYPSDGNDQETARNIAADAMSRGVAKHVWRGNPETVNALVVSPDGNVVATASGKVLQLLDRFSGRRIAKLDIPPVFSLVFTPDGKRLVGSGQDGTIVLVDTATNAIKILGKLSGGWGHVLVFSPPAGVFVTADTTNAIWVWPLDGSQARRLAHYDVGIVDLVPVDGAVMAAVSSEHQLALHRVAWDGNDTTVVTFATDGFANAVHFAADGRSLVAARGDRVLTWKMGDAQLAEVAKLRTDVSATAIDAHGNVLAGGQDGTVASIVPTTPVSMLVGHYRMITALAFDSTGTQFASGDESGAVRLWTATGMTELPGHDGTIEAIAFAGKDALITASHDYSTRAWTIRHPARVLGLSGSDLFRVAWLSPTRVLTTGRMGSVDFVDLSTGVPDSKSLPNTSTYDFERLRSGDVVVSAWDGGIAIFGPDHRLKSRFEHAAQVWHVAASPDDRYVASAGIDGAIKLWTVATGNMRVLDHHAGQALDVAFSPDGGTVVTSGEDPDLHVIDMAHLDAPARSLHGHTGNVMSLVFSHDGSTVYSAGGDGQVRASNIATGASRLFAGHDSRVRTIALSADQRFLASGDIDGRIVVWDLEQEGKPRVLAGHTAEARHVAFSPSGHLLASAGWDGTVRLWDLDSGRVTIWRGHAGKVHRVAFSPDGTRVASVGEDGLLRIWSVADQIEIPDDDKLKAWLDSVTTAVVDGRHVLTPD